MIIYFNNTQIDLSVNDNSYRYRAIKGEHGLTIYYSLPQHIEIPNGAYCIFEGETYTLERPENFKKHGNRNFEYTLIMEAAQVKLNKYKFKDITTRRLKFSLTAKPKQHLQMIVDNLNQREQGWVVGNCIEAVEKVISYNHAYCNDALSQIAEAFETEWEIVGKTINLCKVEYNKSNPLPLSYGRGNGFKSGIGRSNTNNTNPVEILFVQGGIRNIDASKYGSSELLLPKIQTIGYDGEYFSDHPDFNSNKARWYVTDSDGFSLKRSDKPLSSQSEDSLDCSHIYPSRVGTISAVYVVDAEKHFYDIIDNSIPENLNFEECLIEGETMTIIFQSGMLTGKEFDVKYIHEDRRFEIAPQEIDGRTMPDEIFSPQVGQQYAVFGMMMPEAYICDNATKTGASWDMFREAVKYKYENEESKFTFTGELDGIWAKKDWLNIGGRIKLGGYVLFTDNQFQPDGVLIRIIGIKDYINNPHSPTIELSNEIVTSSIASDLRKIETNEIIVDDLHKDAVQFTKRRFRDSQETLNMLQDALLNFSDSISPITVQTMAMLVGDESLQFRFVNNTTNPFSVPHAVTFDAETKILTSPSGIIQHLTIGIKTLSSQHAVSEYKFWNVPEFNSPPLSDTKKRYYLYARVNKTNTTGEFRLSENAIKLDQEDVYNLLVGILNSEFDDERSYVDLYGFTEVLPGRITTEKVVSSDGLNFIDFLNNAVRVGNNNTSLEFNTQGNGQLILKGTLVQSQSGVTQPLGCFRGAYNSTYIYYKGDEVTYNGSMYRYVLDTPTSYPPTNAAFWAVIAQKGEMSFTWIKYADDASGNGISDNPTNKKYIGLAHNKTTSNESDNPADYQWALISGEQGIQGDTGDDGKTLYTWIKYSDYPDGTNMYDIPNDDTEYIGIAANKITSVEGTDKTEYSWSKFRGDDGVPGSYKSLVFQYSSVRPYTPTSTNPIPPGWYDAPYDMVNDDRFWWMSSATVTYVNGEWKAGTWGMPVKVTGEDGEPGEDGKFWDYKYKVYPTQPATPTGLNPSGWSDIPQEVTIGNYLWMSFCEKSADQSTILQQWSTPVRISGEKGNDGNDGNDGKDGDFFEYRYAKNGSTTSCPAFNPKLSNPGIAWKTQVPELGVLEYLWMTVSKKDSDENLIQEWSTPVRHTPVDGKDGKTGSSPALVYRGVYDSSKLYYGNEKRVDAVKYGNTYYVARIDAYKNIGSDPDATFSILPTNINYWNTFGASFESVATGLLLAELAYIENLIVGRLSTGKDDSLPRLLAGQSELAWYNNKADEGNTSRAMIRMGKDVGSMQVTGNNKPGISISDVFGDSKYTEITSAGIFTNGSNIRGLAGSIGIQALFSIASLLQNRIAGNIAAKSINAAVFGIDQTDDTVNYSEGYGGYFNKLRAEGLYLGIQTITDSSLNSNPTGAYAMINKNAVFVIAMNNSVSGTFILDTEYNGKIFFIKNINNGAIAMRAYDSTTSIYTNQNIGTTTINIAKGDCYMCVFYANVWYVNKIGI
jgi:hypothetical protein